jgi:hypothetical protein
MALNTRNKVVNENVAMSAALQPALPLEGADNKQEHNGQIMFFLKTSNDCCYLFQLS